MKTDRLVVTVSLRWWVIPYLHTLELFCLLTGCEPDDEKVAEFILRHGGVKVTE